MKSVRGVILDIDGTLVDSNDAHTCAWIEALAERGITVPFKKVRERIGMGSDRLLPAVSGVREDSAEGKQISKRCKEIFKARYLPCLHAFPGVKDLLRRMHGEGLKLAVATSAAKDELQPLLDLCGADGLIEPATSSADVAESKPAPDVVNAALKQLKLPAAEVVMLADTPYDIESAGRAGVGVIAERCGGWNDAGLTGAIAIYNDPADLLKQYDQSPLARRE
jgi:HAD superfamily hydrolase (TIGR01509 family)